MRQGSRKSIAGARAGSETADAALPHVTEMLAQKIATLSRALDRQAEAIVAERTEMTLIETRTLAYVEAHAPIAMTELASGMFIDSGQMSRLVSKLVALGYIERTRNDDDQRSIQISLTPRGQAAYARMQKSVHIWNRRLMAELRAEDVKTLNLALDRLTEFVAGYVKAQK